MGEEDKALIKQNIGSGKILDLQPGSRYIDLIKSMAKEDYSPTNYEGMIANFVTDLLIKTNGEPVIFSTVAFQHDLVVSVASYFYEGERRYTAQVNFEILGEFTNGDIDSEGFVIGNQFLEDFNFLRLPGDLGNDILNGIADKIRDMNEWLSGKEVAPKLTDINHNSFQGVRLSASQSD